MAKGVRETELDYKMWSRVDVQHYVALNTMERDWGDIRMGFTQGRGFGQHKKVES